MPPPDEAPDIPKSRRPDEKSFVTFVNRTPTSVDIIWLNYQGKCVRYKNGLAPGAYHHIDTFVTHPWRAWESGTEYACMLGGQTVYNPVAWRGERTRTVVYIDRPMHSLLTLCIRRVRTLVRAEDILSLEIPRHLFSDLRRQRENTLVQEYVPRQRRN